MLNSYYTQLCSVSLPWHGRDKYMHSFDLSNPRMPKGYEDYLKIVTRLCAAAGRFIGEAHVTVDEKIVKAGMSQRRPKPHVDGCFMKAEGYWGHPGWLHTCNNVGVDKLQRMSVIVASSVAGCKAWEGRFYGEPKSDGDLSHIQDQLGDGQVLPANIGYLLSPDCVHESMIFERDVKRTFLRIALPNEA